MLDSMAVDGHYTYVRTCFVLRNILVFFESNLWGGHANETSPPILISAMVADEQIRTCFSVIKCLKHAPIRRH